MKNTKPLSELSKNESVVESGSNQVLEEKLDRIIKHLEAIDWKIWIYLKANKYIVDEKDKK